MSWLKDVVQISEVVRRENGFFALDLSFIEPFLPTSRPLIAGLPPERASSVQSIVRLGLAREIIGRVRRPFPYLSVVFCDENTEPDHLLKADLEPVQRVCEIRRTQTRALAYGKREHVGCAVAFLEGSDLYGLEIGLVEQVPPATYLYLANRKPANHAALLGSVEEATNEEDLLSRVLKEDSVLLRLGPDGDFYEVISPRKSYFAECGLVWKRV
jgi:hypothetical protein